jgi:hypothetical protein
VLTRLWTGLEAKSQHIPGKFRSHQEPKRFHDAKKLSDRQISSLVGVGQWLSPLDCGQPVLIFRANAEITDTLTRKIIRASVQATIFDESSANIVAHSRIAHQPRQWLFLVLYIPQSRSDRVQVRFDSIKSRRDLHDEKLKHLKAFSRVARLMAWST